MARPQGPAVVSCAWAVRRASGGKWTGPEARPTVGGIGARRGSSGRVLGFGRAAVSWPCAEAPLEVTVLSCRTAAVTLSAASQGQPRSPWSVGRVLLPVRRIRSEYALPGVARRLRVTTLCEAEGDTPTSGPRSGPMVLEQETACVTAVPAPPASLSAGSWEQRLPAGWTVRSPRTLVTSVLAPLPRSWPPPPPVPAAPPPVLATPAPGPGRPRPWSRRAPPSRWPRPSFWRPRPSPAPRRSGCSPCGRFPDGSVSCHNAFLGFRPRLLTPFA